MNHFKRAHYRQLTTHIFYLEKFSLAGRAINGTSRNFTVLELFIDTMLKGHLNTVIRHDIWIYLVVWPYSEYSKILRNPGYSSNGGVWWRAWLEHWDWGIIQL